MYLIIELFLAELSFNILATDEHVNQIMNKTTQPKVRLSEIASVLYNDDASYGEILEVCKTYKDILLEASQLDISNEAIDNTIFTESGKAIGSKWASLCVEDFLRTKRFCNGLLKGVQKVRSDHPEKKVHILYAGTGPFATIALPLISEFTSEEIVFTLLEINENSYHALKKTLSFFEADDYLDNVLCQDATTYKVTSPDSVDILVTEAMMNGLKSEPHVAITVNLMSQLPKEVIMIPQEICLNILGVNSEIRAANKQSLEAPKSYYEKFGTLFRFNKKEIYSHQDTFLKAFPNFEFPEVKTRISDNANMRYDELCIETHIVVFEDEVLGIDESALTGLLLLTRLNPMLQTVREVASKYICGTNPGLQCRLVN